MYLCGVLPFVLANCTDDVVERLLVVLAHYDPALLVNPHHWSSHPLDGIQSHSHLCNVQLA